MVLMVLAIILCFGGNQTQQSEAKTCAVDFLGAVNQRFYKNFSSVEAIG